MPWYLIDFLTSFGYVFFCPVRRQIKGKLEIHHLEPDDMVIRDNYITRDDFFAIKNFNINNEQHKIQVDSFVLNYVMEHRFLDMHKNAKWGLIFYRYGDGITKNTPHEYNTDYTIHTLFAPQKHMITYVFNSEDGYVITYYYFKGELLVEEKRQMIMECYEK